MALNGRSSSNFDSENRLLLFVWFTLSGWHFVRLILGQFLLCLLVFISALLRYVAICLESIIVFACRGRGL